MTKGGHHRRLQLVLNDGKRWSSMKNRKSTVNGAFWVVVILTNSLNTKTSMINNSIVIRSVNTNVNAPSANFSFTKRENCRKAEKNNQIFARFPIFYYLCLKFKNITI